MLGPFPVSPFNGSFRGRTAASRAQSMDGENSLTFIFSTLCLLQIWSLAHMEIFAHLVEYSATFIIHPLEEWGGWEGMEKKWEKSGERRENFSTLSLLCGVAPSLARSVGDEEGDKISAPPTPTPRRVKGFQTNLFKTLTLYSDIRCNDHHFGRICLSLAYSFCQ